MQESEIGMIEVSDLTKSYAGNAAVNGISFTVARGEIVGAYDDVDGVHSHGFLGRPAPSTLHKPVSLPEKSHHLSDDGTGEDVK